MKRMATFALGAAAAVLLLITILYSSVYVQERKPDNPQTSDCIIVLGSKVNAGGPSKSLQGRLERALSLYQEGYARAFIVCGGKRTDEPDTEAAVMAAWLEQHDVPPDDIFLDSISVNTKENIREAKRIMQEQGFASAIVCTSDYHAYRSMRLARDAGLTASSAKARTEWDGKPVARLRESLSWIKYFIAK